MSSTSAADRQAERKLAEARQNGQVAPAIDVKTDKMINPHNPEFLTKRPWYLGDQDQGPSLDHLGDQRLEGERRELSLSAADALLKEQRAKEQQQRRAGKASLQVGMWVEALKGGKMPYRICQIVKVAKKGTVFDLKYEDGSIERKVKLKQRSTSKPRIRTTKSGNRSYEIDNQVYGKDTYDSKRDAYHGFDAETHMKRVQRKFEQREAIRREQVQQKKKEEAAAAAAKNGGKSGGDADKASDSDFDDSDVDDSDDDDEFVQKDADDKMFTSRLARQGGVGGAQMKVTARNLRIREDTAKYLHNLDVSSAYYDPKSRSMRDNPNPHEADAAFSGDNFSRISGDAVGLAETQLFAWDAADKGVAAIHPQANPSQAELLKKQYKSKSTDLKAAQKKAVLDKYGGAEYLDGSQGLGAAVESKSKPSVAAAAAQRKARFGVSVEKQEYTRDGRLLQDGQVVKRKALKSKYQEDVLTNGHTTVWGSYFHKGAFRWGYADDHSLIRNSYCTGANGRRVNDEANEMRYGTGVGGSAMLAQAREMLKAIPAAQRNAATAASSSLHQSSKMYGEADQKIDLDEDKLRAAIEKNKAETTAGDRKRKYNPWMRRKLTCHKKRWRPIGWKRNARLTQWPKSQMTNCLITRNSRPMDELACSIECIAAARRCCMNERLEMY